VPSAIPTDMRATFAGHDLACIRGNRLVFSELAFAIAPGTATLLRGPNGAGKSSLLRLAAGLLHPATGRLTWDERDASRDREDHRRRIRYVGHLDAVKPVLTATENLAHWAAIYGTPTDPEALVSALASLDLGALASLPARFLSAGQRRRLNLARLVVSPGQLWLLDEPTVSLDAASVALLERAIRSHLEAGGSALIATHGDLDIGTTDHLTLTPAPVAEMADA